LQQGKCQKVYSGFYAAVADYTVAIELKNDFARAYHNRALARFLKKDTEGACDDWSKAMDLGYYIVEEDYKRFCIN
ncbi:MAG: hypothetical protein KJ607_11515, partial [Bacteroidetes bacterium]|nr:hypothetical protein [Bacteroidota bacterium]